MRESERLVELLQRTIAGREDLRECVVVCSYTCFGRCDDGPNTFVHELAPGEDGSSEPAVDVLERERGFYPGMDEARVLRVLEEHVAGGRVVEDLVDRY
jgi:(2Fe-2S) ferredoxin